MENNQDELVSPTPKTRKWTPRRIAVVFVIAAAAFFAFSGIMLEVTSKPEFCGSCHNMTPYIESWRASSHNTVNCAQCHYEPGFYNYLKGKITDGQAHLVIFITGKARGKYHAEIPDASCKECHPTDQLTGEKEFQGVTFSHPNHLNEMRRGKKLRCVTCHGQIVQGEHLTVDPRDCFICHFKADENGKRDPVLSDCRTCHTEVPMQIQTNGRMFEHGRYFDEGSDCRTCHVDIVAGQGEVDYDRCVECHSEREKTLREIVTTQYTSETYHKNHVTDHKVECWRCHSRIEHEIVRNPTSEHFGENCTVCHADQQHFGPRELYRGVGGVGVPEMPSKMYRANVDCASCHVKSSTGKYGTLATDVAYLSMGAACDKCHGEGYADMLHHWQDIMRTQENAAAERLSATEKALLDAKKKVSIRTYEKAAALIGDAAHNIRLVRVGRGHHNMEYALKLLEAANVMGEQARELLIEDYEPEKVQPFEMTCTNLCHSEMSTRKVTLGSVNYPHKTHIDEMGFACTECHGGMDKHGENHFTNCADCHHGEGQGKVTCADCHQDIAGLVAGTAGVGAKSEPDEMNAQLECVNCHTQIAEGSETTSEVILATCVECHEEGYDKKAAEWTQSIRKGLAGQKPKLEQLRKDVDIRKANGANITKLANLLLRIESNNELIEGERGQHNLPHAMNLLKANDTMFDRARELIKDEHGPAKPIDTIAEGNPHDE
ncbi:NapC/NirT family cytochrome c [bacterium]|nr:NapC/NirT family cytochrome c [bacterium]